jgi:tetratricopeptide (TPR) repeat protein
MFATASHLSYLGENKHNHDVFAFAGNAKTCAEVHASVVSGKPDEEKALHDALAEFHPDLLYRPVWLDYYEEATAFYRQSPMIGAPFYDAALKAVPEGTSDAEVLKARRIATDNVVIALGMRGDITQARRYAEHGIKTDPGYPINYYNLACADAEEGKASDAKVHLQQAFDRKANVIAGEKMPDPTKDDSIMKLKTNREFWAFVESLR